MIRIDDEKGVDEAFVVNSISFGIMMRRRDA